MQQNLLRKPERRIDLKRFISFFIAAVLSAAMSLSSYATDDLSAVLAGAAFGDCAALPSQKCVLILAREVALKDTKSDAAAYLARVAVAQAKAGLRDDAEATIELVRRRLDGISEYGRYEALPELVEALARLGKFDDALTFARSGNYPSDMLATIAIHRAHAGQLSEGLGLLLPLPPFERHLAIRRFAWAARYVALERGEEGMLIEALHVIERQEWSTTSGGLHHASQYPPAVSILTQPLAETGRFDEAWRLALSIRSEWERPDALAEIAILEVRAGGISLCLRRLLAVDDGQLRSNVLQQTLEGLVSKTSLERSKTALELSMRYGFDDGVPLRPGRLTGTPAEDLAEALKLAEALPQGRDRDFALGLVVAAQMQSGVSSQAWSTALSIADSSARYLTFSIVGRTEALVGRKAEARTAYLEAIASTKIADCRTQRRPCSAGYIVASLAAEIGHAGLINEAFDAAGVVPGSEYGASSHVLYGIAQAQVRLGAIDVALATARASQGSKGYSLGTGIVAFELAKGGRIIEALSIADQLLVRRKQDTLRIIVRERTEAGAYQQALQVVEAMDGAKDKVFALAGIGWGALHAGQRPNANEMFARALRAAQAEGDMRSCLRSLLHIASSMGTEPVPIDYEDIYSLLPWIEPH